jgi:hypothetical protein
MFSYENVDEAARVGMLASCPFLIMGFAFMVWPPNWVKPAWLHWLEREYGYCLDILVEEAQKMNRWEWEAKVRTQEGMQAWIDEVFERRREEVDLLWRQTSVQLLIQQAKAEGRPGPSFGERIKGYVPEHRRQQDENRIREELEEYKKIQKRGYR